MTLKNGKITPAVKKKKPSLNSKKKGKVGELEWAHYCTSQGHPCRRGIQYKGGQESPDVVCIDSTDVMDCFHQEVKRVQNLHLGLAMKQAIGDAGGKIPIVAHRRNHEEWLVTMRAEDWFKLVE